MDRFPKVESPTLETEVKTINLSWYSDYGQQHNRIYGWGWSLILIFTSIDLQSDIILIKLLVRDVSRQLALSFFWFYAHRSKFRRTPERLNENQVIEMKFQSIIFLDELSFEGLTIVRCKRF